MKNFKHFFKTQLAVAFVLLSVNFGFAQVVSVPSNCNVIVTNTLLGGVYGLGGKVTDGGIVGMPDPTGGGTFTFGAFGTNIIGPAVGWTIKGDLSTVNALSIPLDPLSYYNAATQTASGVSTNIVTYNKKLRPSENVSTQSPNNVAAWARSKGRVTVGFTIVNGSFSCGNTMTFEVFKIFPGSVQLNPANILIQPTNLPKIVGPDCIVAGQPVTFSVDQVASDNANDAIGFDSYYWSGLPLSGNIALNSLYYSADNSSVTFTPTVATPLTLICCLGKLNANIIPSGSGPDPVLGTLYNACVSKKVGILPTQPNLSITGLCVDTSNSVLNFNFIGTPIYDNTLNYVWTNPGNLWSITPGTPGTWNFNKNGDNNPGILTLTITNGGCAPAIFNYNIKRSFVAPLTITGANCIVQGAPASNYALSPVANLNAVTWTSSPAGLTLTAGTGSQINTVNIVAPTTSAVGRYTLTATSLAPCESSINYTIDVQPPTPLFTTTLTTPVGTSQSCVLRTGGPTVIYTCKPIVVASPGVASYLWGIPAGWGIAAGYTNPSTTPSIGLIPGGTAASVQVAVTARVTNAGVLSTCQSNTTGFNVNYNPVAPAIAAITCWNTSMPMPATKTLTITNVQNYGSYTVTPNASLFSGASVSGGTITLNNPVFLNTGTYSIVVNHNNGTCTPIASTTLTFSVTAAASSVAYAGATAFADNYTYSLLLGETFVAWQVNNATVTANGTTVGILGTQLSLAGTSAISNVSVIVSSGGCLKRIYSPTIGTRGAARQASASSGGTKDAIRGVTIYPNPNNGNFSIKLENFTESATASLVDITGKVFGTYTLKKGDNKIENAGLASGNYFIQLTVDGKTETRKIIIK